MVKKYGRKKKSYIRRTGRKRNSRLDYALGKAKPSYKMRRTMRMFNAMAEAKIAVNTFTVPQNIVGGGFQLPPPSISQGAGKGQRVGNKIFVKYLIWKLRLFSNASNARVLRWAIGMSKNNVWEPTSDGPITYFCTNWDYDKFSIIKEGKTILCQSGTTTNTNNNSNAEVIIVKKLKINKTYTFDDTSGLPIQEYPWFWITQYDVVAAPFPQIIDCTCTITYTDV